MSLIRSLFTTFASLGSVKANAGTYPTFLGTEADDFSFSRAPASVLQSSWIYSNAQRIGGIISSTDFQVKERQGEKIVDVGDHELETLMLQPNEFMTRWAFLQVTATSLAVTGQAFWYLATIGNNILEMWYIPSTSIRPIQDKANFISGFEYSANGQLFVIPPELVVWFRNPHPFDQWAALSPVEALRLSITSDLHAQEWNRNFFGKNHALPSVIISMPQETSKPDFDAIKDEIRKEFRAINRKTMIARAGNVKVEPISLSQTDMQFLDGRAFTRDEIDRVMLGTEISGVTTEEGIKAIDRRIKDWVWSMAVYFAQQMTLSIVRPFFGENLLLEPVDFRPQDRALAAQEYTVFSQDRTTNENRAEQGLEPVALPEANIPVRLLSTALLFDSPPSMAGSQAPQAAQTQEEQQALRSAKNDLVKWKRKAKRGSFAFDSDNVPDVIAAWVKSKLKPSCDLDDVFDHAIKSLGNQDSMLITALVEATDALRNSS